MDLDNVDETCPQTHYKFDYDLKDLYNVEDNIYAVYEDTKVSKLILAKVEMRTKMIMSEDYLKCKNKKPLCVSWDANRFDINSTCIKCQKTWIPTASDPVSWCDCL